MTLFPWVPVTVTGFNSVALVVPTFASTGKAESVMTLFPWVPVTVTGFNSVALVVPTFASTGKAESVMTLFPWVPVTVTGFNSVALVVPTFASTGKAESVMTLFPWVPVTVTGARVFKPGAVQFSQPASGAFTSTVPRSVTPLRPLSRVSLPAPPVVVSSGATSRPPPV